MKIIEIQPRLTYTCQICQKFIHPNKELDLVEGELPVCSNKCSFKLKYKIFKKYPNQVLRMFWTFAYPNKPSPETRTEAINELTKWFMNNDYQKGGETLENEL